MIIYYIKYYERTLDKNVFVDASCTIKRMPAIFTFSLRKTIFWPYRKHICKYVKRVSSVRTFMKIKNNFQRQNLREKNFDKSSKLVSLIILESISNERNFWYNRYLSNWWKGTIRVYTAKWTVRPDFFSFLFFCVSSLLLSSAFLRLQYFSRH